MSNFIFVLAFALLPRAFSSGLAVEKIVLEADNLTIHGRRYLNENGQPNRGPKVLFTHGLTSNFHEFDGLAARLVRHGYDCYAFNFRGHGNGGERSTVGKYVPGAYAFDLMAEVDFPAMVDFVGNGGREEVTVIGHSMGGMVPRAALAEGFVAHDSISKIVLIGSPSTFDHAKMQWEAFSPFALHELPLWLGAGDKPIFGAGLLTFGARIFGSIPNPAIDWLTRGVVRSENFGAHDTWREDAKSHDIPKDIFRSFARFRHEGFKYENSVLPVPALHILGSDDMLAPWREVVRTGLVQSKEAGAWFVLLNKVSHVDLVAEKPADAFEEVLLRFLDSPESLGPKAGFLHRSLNCSSLLAN